MTYDTALRLTECLLGCAFMQQSLEHCLARGAERRLFASRLVLSAAVALGWYAAAAEWLLLALSVAILRRFQGPYNGGCDRMSLLILICLCLAHLAPTTLLKEASLGYLAVQLVVSYAMSGWVKIRNADWRNGRALADVFEFSAYPVAENLRAYAHSAGVMRSMSWAVMIFELVFPLALMHHATLAVALIIAVTFHAANACLFGLNRFLWIWISAYPALWWWQARVFGS